MGVRPLSEVDPEAPCPVLIKAPPALVALCRVAPALPWAPGHSPARSGCNCPGAPVAWLSLCLWFRLSRELLPCDRPAVGAGPWVAPESVTGWRPCLVRRSRPLLGEEREPSLAMGPPTPLAFL